MLHSLGPPLFADLERDYEERRRPSPLAWDERLVVKGYLVDPGDTTRLQILDAVPPPAARCRPFEPSQRLC